VIWVYAAWYDVMCGRVQCGWVVMCGVIYDVVECGMMWYCVLCCSVGRVRCGWCDGLW